ncbi:antibiotic biosynthesis monooxygenase [Nocardioides sp. Root151]|uniref:antibiotic biosynthesis monooxygenase n=1 Tax=Nocardioides sp. Root151 TaxID=1736475 RepID=UPI00070262FE|nr:antibiotic biosynthesis monooxygenase [Nocardioides sp. Root151]KQZ66784.1 antibiotic biosynthesis monooxygenase [Nocardioides sp. Root151]
MTAVTVSITRHIDPEHNAEMLAWVEAGASLAERFDGFLGVGWVRPAIDSDEWHMLYRFADAAALAVWEASAQRRWWLAAAQGRIGESHVERRTGIEGWFDEPTTYDVSDGADSEPPPPAPPRWKQMVTIFLVFFPLSLAANWVVGHSIADWPLVPRVLASVVVMTPLMTYVFLPWITRRMSWWLHR